MSSNPAASAGGRRRIAVIGSGVAGLTAAYVLNREDDVTLFEADSRLGGHAHTHDMPQPDGTVLGVDTGFIVHNERTYPTLLRLFAELGVETQDSEMSMSIRCDGCGLEYAGARGGARGIIARPSSLLRGRYLLMLLEVTRFYRKARELLKAAPPSAISTEVEVPELTLGEFLEREKFSPYFISHFMTPVVSAVWSCDPTTALAYPARYLFTFLGHHGLLGIKGSPQWRTVTGGSARYVEKLAATLNDVRLNASVTAIRRLPEGVELATADGLEHFDAVVIATHPAQALGFLADATPGEKEALGGMPYSVNHTVFHQDPAVLPAADNAKASWNYRLPSCDARPDKVLVSYDLTRLQRLVPGDGRRYLVSLGESELISDDAVLERMVYEHPQYTPESLKAQQAITALSDGRIAYAGAYLGWGFHEDGALSGVRAAEKLGRTWPAARPQDPQHSSGDGERELLSAGEAA
ncbi:MULTISPECIES: NAD(P)/FAD-dependent oxidoreductase [unclassified Arthrobacter]|uniref:NAD(P)/FAD-dependent oxidoreductase n=1 Tax=unclassified Arthrobacter TaxID=235627 RepID=UPI001C862B0E|nr:FAD-dependent oxidoreductase [Arthrobacter sp. MAHUQ-56]MBX7444498.1 FAD-dependent oxidoreductase [Arthrobacter sp. MAHUQ-56]